MITGKKSQSKFRLLQGTIAVVIILSAQLFASQVDGPTPKDSFLVHQVSTVKELVAELKNHPYIRNRYAALYHCSPENVENYMEKNLMLSTLQHNYTHIVYCITPGGVIFSALETQHKGDKVFALRRTGSPILRWACGNPFTSNLPEPPGLVVFTGINQRRVRAPFTQDFTKQASIPHGVTSIATERVASYLGSLPQTGTVTNIIEQGLKSGPHVPFWPFVPVVPFVPTSGGSSSTSTTTGGSSSTSTTTGGNTSSSTTSTTGSTAGQTTGTTNGSSGTTTGTSQGSTAGTTGTTTTGGPSITPEPTDCTFWTIAGLFLAVGAGVGNRKRSKAVKC